MSLVEPHTRETKFASFPEVLVVHAKKFQLVNWVPAKLGVFAILSLLCSCVLSSGCQTFLSFSPRMASLNSIKGTLARAYNLPRLSSRMMRRVCCFVSLYISNLAHVGPSLAALSLPPFNEAAMGQLLSMGFSELRSQKALLATGNQDPQAAMEWLFEHMDDPGTPLRS